MSWSCGKRRILSIQALLSVFILLLLASCSSSSQKELTLEEKLARIPGITFSKIDSPKGYNEAYEIFVSQPVDHKNPNGPKFNQRILLSHISEDRPMVKYHSGYMTGRNRLSEPAVLLNANQIYITHRYFLKAEPEPLDWQYLDIWQASADHHRIHELFKNIYKGKWLATGYSKGGMTTFYDARFYPGDVDATIAYVAPMMFGVEDPRFRTFQLEQVGTPEGREKIKSFQRLCLANRDQLIPYYIDFAQKNNVTYKFSVGATLEYSVIEYMFSFWQYGDGDVSKIPGEEAGADAWFDHLENIISPYNYVSDDITLFQPFFYQAYTQLGYYAYIYDHLSDLLVDVPNPTPRSFAPENAVMNFDAAAMQDINTWLQDEGNNIVYIYGGNDPYTSTAVELTGKTNALKVIQPGGNHGTDIASLDDKERVIATLKEWLDMSINISSENWMKAEEINRERVFEDRLRR